MDAKKDKNTKLFLHLKKWLEKAVLDSTRRAAHATDVYVHNHPWESIGIGASVGLLLGMLITRR